jgi:DNA-binding NarL/FixJ family response regulator
LSVANPPARPTVRVLLADDQELVRDGFAMILSGQPDLELVGEAADGAEAIRAARELDPDVVLMDVRMPRVDGIAATTVICRDTRAKVLVLTTFDLDEYVYDALRAGASGFLLKDMRRTELVEAIRVVAAGEALVAPPFTRRLLDRFADKLPTAPPPLASLTSRERQVLELLAQGLSNREIAAELSLCESTIKCHVSGVLAKLGLRDRAQAVAAAFRARLIPY